MMLDGLLLNPATQFESLDDSDGIETHGKLRRDETTTMLHNTGFDEGSLEVGPIL